LPFFEEAVATSGTAATAGAEAGVTAASDFLVTRLAADEAEAAVAVAEATAEATAELVFEVFLLIVLIPVEV
jgi:hypothetical protein